MKLTRSFVILALLTGTINVKVSIQNQDTCDLDQIANNVNPGLLRSCNRDVNCTQLTCLTDGILKNSSSFKLTVESCSTPPGIRIELVDDDGNVSVNQLVTEPMVVTDNSSDVIFIVTVLFDFAVFFDSTTSSINITIDSESVYDNLLLYLINITSIPIDQCRCSFGCCAAETVMSQSRTTYIWPQVFGGETATFTCPLSPEFMVTRSCQFGGVWQEFDEYGCDTVNGQLIRLESLFNNLTQNNYEQAVAQLSQIIKLSKNNITEQNSEVLSKVPYYLSQLAIFVKESSVIIGNTVVDDVVQIVNSLIQWEPKNIVVTNSSIVIESFEVVTSAFAQQLSLNEKQNFTTPSVTLVAELIDIKRLLAEGRSFAIGESKIEVAMADNVMPGQLSPQLDATISLPSSLFELISDRTNSSIIFSHYFKSTLFPVNGGNLKNVRVGTDILAATVVGAILTDFENVTIIFRSSISIISKKDCDEMCVSWNFTLQDWTPEGCTTNVSIDGVVTCSCDHLTNFAVLVNIACTLEPPNFPSDVHVYQKLGARASEVALTFISYIGISISIFFLIISVVTLLLFKKLRQKDASKFHIQLCLAMLFMLTVSFVLVVYSAKHLYILYEGCVVVSFLVHYFTLASVMLMGAEALIMFKKLVLIFSQVTTKFIVSVSIVCWILPILLAVIPLILELIKRHGIDNIGIDNTTHISIRRSDTQEGISFCFISHSGVLWGTFLTPILAIMVFNVFIFICIIIVLIRHEQSNLKVLGNQEKISAKTILRKIFSLVCVMFLFGLTWLFAILLFTVKFRALSQILFTIFNSFQGFFIFLFILNTEATWLWRKLLSCGSKTSQFRLSVTKQKKAGQLCSKTGYSSFTGHHSTSEMQLKSKQGLSYLKAEEKIVESEDVANLTKKD